MKNILILIAILFTLPSIASAGLDSGLLRFFPLDTRDIVKSSDTVGSVFDRSGNGGNTTITSFASINGAKSIGKQFQALTFDGTDDRLNQTLSSGLSGSFTFAAWVYPTKSSTGAFSVQCIIASEVASYSNYWACFGPFDNSGLRMHFGLYDGTNNPLANDTTTITLNKWVHVVGVRNTTTDTVNLFINGVLVTSVNDTTTSVPTYSAFNIGGQANVANRYFGGKLDEVMIYNRALSNEEINQLYRRGLIKKLII